MIWPLFVHLRILKFPIGRQGYKPWNEAVAAERRCADKLRRRGYGVWWG